jgi:hypothetical protein
MKRNLKSETDMDAKHLKRDGPLFTRQSKLGLEALLVDGGGDRLTHTNFEAVQRTFDSVRLFRTWQCQHASHWL